MLNFESAPRSPYGDRLPDERLLRETQDVRAVTVARSVEVGYALLNRHRIGEAAAIVAIGGFLSDLTMPDRAYEGVQLAALDRPVLMLDLPGHGLSSPHDRQQAVDLCIHRTADSQAAPLVDAVQELLGSDDQLDYFGISHGALVSLKSAELDPADRVITVFGIDLPAIKKRKTLGLQAGYMVKDNIVGRRQYLEALKDSPFQTDFEVFKETYAANAPARAQNFIKKNPGLFVLNLFASINARPGGAACLEKCFGYQRDKGACRDG